LKKTLNLRKSNAQLSEINEELDQFNRILSHDLKEPLRSIVGFSKLASKPGISSSKTKEYLEFVTNSGTQLHQLIQDVNTFQTVNNISNTEHDAINTPLVLDQIIRRLKESYPDKNIK